MKFNILAMSCATMSVVCALSETSFVEILDGVDCEQEKSTSSFVFEDQVTSTSSFISDSFPSLSQSTDQDEEPAASDKQSVVATDRPAGVDSVTPEVTAESWWSYGKRMACRPLDVAYQYLRSNRWAGVESGSAQSWSALTKLDNLKANWTVNSKQQLLIANNNESVISMQASGELITEEYAGQMLKGALAKASKIQKKCNARKVYLPLSLNLKNYVSGDDIRHRVTMETIYDDSGSLSSVRILDPQTKLSGCYFSNTSLICEEAFKALKLEDSNISVEYRPVGIQLPGTGNCQKMAAYMAVALGEGEKVEDLTLNKANSFSTQMHNAAEASSKAKPNPNPKPWFGGWMPRLR